MPTAARAVLPFIALAVSLAAPSVPTASAADAPSTGGRLTLQELRARYLRPQDHLVTIGGVEVRYRDEGRGPAVLLLHGSNSTLETYDGMVERLKSHYRLIRFDTPPVGLSGSVSDAAIASLPSPEALMTGLLDSLKIPSVVAVGVSSGGTMAYYLAGAEPQRVCALILANTPSDPVDTSGVRNPPELEAAKAAAARTGVGDRDFWWAYFRFLYGDPGRITPALIERLYDMNRRVPEAHPLHLYALTAHNEVTLARLAAVRAPTLLVWGMRDPVLPYRTAVALRDHLTGTTASLLLLDDVGHYPTLEVPDRFAAILRNYVEAVLTASSSCSAVSSRR